MIKVRRLTDTHYEWTSHNLSNLKVIKVFKFQASEKNNWISCSMYWQRKSRQQSIWRHRQHGIYSIYAVALRPIYLILSIPYNICFSVDGIK